MRFLLAMVLALVPAIVAAWHIATYGVNVPYWDEWDFVPLLDKLYAGNLSLSDLLAQHNEHRIPFPRLAMLLLAPVTHYNVVVQMYVGWLFLALSAWLIYQHCRRNSDDAGSALVTFVPVAFLLFSLRQNGNLLWGWQLQIFLANLGFLLAIHLITSVQQSRWRFPIAVAAGVVSSFSFANGLLIWPIGLFGLLWLQRFQIGTVRWLYVRLACLWTFAGLLVFLLYFTGYAQPVQHQAPLEFVREPGPSLAYFFAALGGAFTPDARTAVGFGIITLALSAYLSARAWHLPRPAAARATLPLGLVLFGVLSQALLVTGRSAFGLETAVVSRYASSPLLGIVGLYLLVQSLPLDRERLKPFLSGVLLALIALGAITAYSYAALGGETLRARRAEEAYYLTTVQFQSNRNLVRLFPDPEVVRERAPILQKYRLSTFGEARVDPHFLAPSDRRALAAIEAVNGRSIGDPSATLVVDGNREETIVIAGWAVDHEAEAAAGGAFLNVDDRLDIPMLYGLPRQDVARDLEQSRYGASGFSGAFATSVLEKGRHTFTLKVLTSDKQGYYRSVQPIALEIR